MSELCNILEHILQMTESVAAAFPYNRDHSTIVDLTKMAQRQLAIGKNRWCMRYDEKNSVQPDLMHKICVNVFLFWHYLFHLLGALKVVLICDIFTKHKADLSRDERQEIIQSCRKR